MLKKVKILSIMLVFTLVSIFTTSCGAAKQNENAAPYQGNESQTNTPSPSDSPKEEVWVDYVTKYLENENSSDLINKAMDLLSVQCAKENGFGNISLPPRPQNGGVIIDAPKLDPTWGAFDIEYSKKYGYLAKSLENGEASQNGLGFISSAEDLQKSQHSQDSGQVKDPVDKTGKSCNDVGEEKFSEGITIDKDRSESIGQLGLKMTENAMNDPRMTQKVKEWSQCVKNKGFNFDYPPYSKLSSKNSLTNDESIRGDLNKILATADVECKQQTDFMNYWHSVLDDVEKQEVQNNLPLFEAEKASNQKVIEHANEIIKKYG
jgi:hypothetical protein